MNTKRARASEVLYLPEQPREARIRGFFDWRWLVAAGLAGMSIAFVVIFLRAAYAEPKNAAN